MPMRDKIITAVCRTSTAIEWTSLHLKEDAPEPQHHALPISFPKKEVTREAFNALLPEGISEQLQGDVTAALRTSELLMRVLRFPSIDPEEIAGMVEFQIEKISPFPVDQLAISHEILSIEKETSLVLMVAAKRTLIDSIGEVFQEKGVHIHSIDARILGWLKLLKDEGQISDQPCEVLIIDDGIDFSLVVLSEGVPLAFRMLDAQLDELDAVDELAYEIGYTLTTLEAEHPLAPPSSIRFWTHQPLPEPFCEKLTQKSSIPASAHLLEQLPPLSEGIIRRAVDSKKHIELIPAEWIEHEKQKNLRRKFILATSAIAACWILLLLGFYTAYKIRDIRLSKLRAEMLAIEPAAKTALQNRRKLQTLTLYTDRSDSALECLREATRLLPPGDIKFVSFNYRKGKGISLRGTAATDNMAYNYLDALSKSSLFSELKDQSVNNRNTRGVRRSVFTLSLTLPAREVAP
jgi:hypothetical protein